LLSIFSEAEVNIEYMYAFLGGSDVKSAYMIFRVADTKGAEARLTKKGLRVLTQEDIANI
ncbi:MAG TPA: acetolactate synthase, partial [Lachnospiraceae bacterium]|nr:acetolactate synthase [Lachnospiraceae bacterium]